jgi:hypothetical protein
VGLPQKTKDAQVVASDPLLTELKSKKAEEVSAWVESKTTTTADIQTLLKSLTLAVHKLSKYL